jgi:hypothetical protein
VVVRVPTAGGLGSFWIGGGAPNPVPEVMMKFSSYLLRSEILLYAQGLLLHINFGMIGFFNAQAISPHATDEDLRGYFGSDGAEDFASLR